MIVPYSTRIKLVSLTIGLGGFIFYMYTVQVTERFSIPQLLWISLVLMSTSLVLLRSARNRNVFLLALFSTSVSLAFWFWLRFGNRILFPDIFSEIAVAQEVRKLGWTADIIWKNRYGSALSVTILPVALSEVLGLGVSQVFLFVFPAVLALTPILLFFVFNEAFGFEVASLACLIYIFDYVALTLNPFIIRDCFGKFFFLLFILSLLRYTRNKAKRSMINFTLVMIFAFSAASATYATSYFFIGFVLLLLVFPYVLRYLRHFSASKYDNQRHVAISSRLLLSVIVIILTWSSLVAFLSLTEASRYGVKTLQQVAFGETHPYNKQIFSYPRGNSISNCITITYRLAIIIGFFIAFWLEWENHWALILAIWGGVLLIVLLAWLFFPGLAMNIMNPDRAYSNGLIMFSVFVAISLSRASWILKRSAKLKTYPILKNLIISAIVTSFLLNNVCVMPALYYYPSSLIRTEEAIIIPLFGEVEFSTKQWKENFIPQYMTSYGDEKYNHVCILLGMDIQWTNQTSYPSNLLKILLDQSNYSTSEKSYILVPYYLIEYGYSISSFFYSQLDEPPKGAHVKYHMPSNIIMEMNKEVVGRFLGKSNQVYSNRDYQFILIPKE